MYVNRCPALRSHDHLLSEANRGDLCSCFERVPRHATRHEKKVSYVSNIYRRDGCRLGASEAEARSRCASALPSPEVFSIPEFCAWARVSRTTAFKEVAAGRLKARRIGRKSLVTLDAARAWVNSLPAMRA
jgi:hypothetical protein